MSGERRRARAQGELDRAVAACWRRGWSPADVVHVVGRHHPAALRDVVTAAVIADGQRRREADEPVSSRWLGEVDDLAAAVRSLPLVDVSFVRDAARVVAGLPPVHPTMPAPGEAGAEVADLSRLDPRMLDRVRALLAKAESTTFEEEAQAFTAKAQELIARHAIGDALLRDVDDVGDPSARRIRVDDPYTSAKFQLVAEVASANRCRVVLFAHHGWVTAFGYPHDLDALELLTASLLSQATAAMLAHGSVVDAVGRSRTASFRHAFLLGFAQRIGQRLRAANDESVAAAAAESTALVPVMTAQLERVDRAVEHAYPNLGRKRVQASNGRGWQAGRSAAERARLDPARPLRGSGRS